MRFEANRILVDRALQFLLNAPQQADVDVFRQALKSGDPVWTYAAIRALDELCPDDAGLYDRLRSLANQDDPIIRTAAHGALARRGNLSSIGILRETVAANAGAYLGGEAIRWLAQADVAAIFDLLLDTVGSPPRGSCDMPQPPFEEAAVALAQLGTPDALTALLKSAIFNVAMSGTCATNAVVAAARGQKMYPEVPRCRRKLLGALRLMANGGAG
jgi:hypothetical protein